MPTLHLLILEDDPYDAELEIATLEQAGYECRWERVETRSEFIDRISQREMDYDLVLADYNLPSFDGLTALKLFHEHDLDLPFILVSGTMGEETAIESLKAGATDYVMKTRLSRLGPVVERALREKEEQRQRKQAENALRESEEKFRAFMETASDLMHIADKDGNLVYVNEAMAQTLGYSKQEMIGMHISRVLSPDTLNAFEPNLEKLMTTGEVRLEPVWMTKDGKRVYGEIKVVAIYNSEGQFAGSRGILRDITERKRGEKERERLLARIQEQAQRVQQIIDTVPEGVILLEADGQIVVANPVGAKNLDTLAGAKVGDTLTHLGDYPLTKFLTSPPRGLWHDVMLAEQSFQTIARSIETGPALGGWVLVIRDVTQQREFDRRSQQQERLAAVGQLAAGIAHDFNNVMATIILYAQMTARAEELSTRNRERMLTIHQQAQHATKLIQQILDFSRRAVLERTSLDLLPLLKEQVQLLKRTVPENIEIKLEFGPGEHTVHADPTRIQQAITNLVLNARDAMPQGGKLCIELERIQIDKRRAAPMPEIKAGGWIQITVSDTGTGIPPDVLERIFEPFFTTKAPLGNGLGLSQVHGIVAQHEGHINVKTRLNQGTAFTIYLPALPVHLAELPIEALEPLNEGRGETILIVEDDSATQEALAQSLEQLNYQTLTASNGYQALAALEQHGAEIALVLSDVIMPEMGGIALLHAMKERELSIGMVMLTGHPLEEELENLRAQGITLLRAWILKPPTLEELAEVIAQALKQ